MFTQEVGNKSELGLRIRRETLAETAMGLTIEEGVDLDPRSGTCLSEQLEFSPGGRCEISRQPPVLGATHSGCLRCTCDGPAGRAG